MQYKPLLRWIIFFGVLLIGASGGDASTNCSTTGTGAADCLPRIGTVHDVQNAADLSGPNYTSFYLVSYGTSTGTVTDGDGAAGLFVRDNNRNGNGCTRSMDNGGSVLVDNHSAGYDCFYRQNLNGDLRQWGLTKDSIYDGAAYGTSTTDSSTIVSTAVAALIGAGLHEASTHGVNLLWTGDFSVSNQFVIDCGVAVGFVDQNANYTFTNISGIIAHPASAHIIYPSNTNSGGFRNCIIERSGDLTTYSPTVFVPSTARDSINLANAFAGDGLTIHSEAPVLDNVMILGFDRCFDISKDTGAPPNNKAAKRMQMHNVTGDCGSHASATPGQYAAFSIKDVPSGGYFENLRTNSYLAKGGADASSSLFDLDNVIPDTQGQCKAVIHHAADAVFTFMIGDTVWVALGNNNGAQSCTGKWTAGTVTNVLPPNDNCGNALGCQEVTLTGSQFSPTATTATWASGSNMLTLPSNVANNLATGQAATDGGACIPTGGGGTFVGDVIPEWNEVFLVKSDLLTPQPTTCGGSNAAVTFTNGSFSADAGITTILESTIWRAGDGIYMENDGGVTINRCQSYNHQNAIHLYGNSATGRTQLGTIEACAVGTADALPDDSTCGIMIDGNHDSVQPSDADDYTVLGGTWGQHLSNAICMNSNHDNAMKFFGPTIGPAGGKRWGSMIKLLQGQLTICSPQAHGKGNIWVAAGATLNMCGAYLPQGQLYAQSNGSILNGCGNIVQYEEIGGTLFPPRECIGLNNPGFLPIYSNGGTLQSGYHMVQGSITLTSGSATVTLSGAAQYTSGTNYTCNLQDMTMNNPTQLTRTSGSQFIITGTGTDTIGYFCTGT